MAFVPLRKFAVVTGATQGLGLALANECIEHGFDVMLCSGGEEIEDAAALLGREGVKVYAVREDLSTMEGCEGLYAAIINSGRDVDALLLNAGTEVFGPFLETPLEDELETIALNCAHTVHLTKRVLRRMVPRRSGRVLITGPLLASPNGEFDAVYGATQAFVLTFAQMLRRELAGTGVTLTVAHGDVNETAFLNRAGLTDTESMAASESFEAMMEGRP